MNLTTTDKQLLMMVYQARLETTMRSFPSSAEVAREAELEKQELAMKRKRSAHEVFDIDGDDDGDGKDQADIDVDYGDGRA